MCFRDTNIIIKNNCPRVDADLVVYSTILLTATETNNRFSQPPARGFVILGGLHRECREEDDDNDQDDRDHPDHADRGVCNYGGCDDGEDSTILLLCFRTTTRQKTVTSLKHRMGSLLTYVQHS